MSVLCGEDMGARRHTDFPILQALEQRAGYVRRGDAFSELDIRDMDTRDVWGLLKEILLESTDGIALFARDTRRFIEVSDSLCSITGYDRAELLGHTAAELDLVESGDQAESVQDVDAGLQGRYELRITRKDGEQRWLEFSNHLLAGGEYVLAVVRDVTERREQERLVENLLHHEQRLALRYLAVAASLPDTAVLVFDCDERIVEATGPSLERAGWNRHELLGRRLRDISPERFRELEPLVRDALAGVPRSMRGLPGTRGGLVWDIELMPLRGEDGAIIGAAELAHDVTDLHRSQQELRASETRFRRLFDDAPIGMATVGLDRRVQQANQQMSTITGHSTDQLQDMPIQSVIHPDDQTDDENAARALLAGDITTHQAEQRLITAQGEEVWVDASTSLVRDGDGNPQYFIRQQHDITERRRLEQRLRFQAEHDMLTGLPNRRRFTEELTRELAQTYRHRTPGALLSIDLDNFKFINDTLGHAAGDKIIIRVSDMFRQRLRDSDAYGRFGGDEFAVLLTHVDSAQAQHVAADLLETIRGGEPIELPSAPRRLTASVGIALFPQETKLTAEELVVQADIALYDAKEAGRDRVRLYNPASVRETRMQARLDWAERVRYALDHDDFLIHAQPIRALTGDTTSWHELLLRMTSEGGDLIPPATFINIAEQVGLAPDIDRWVLARAVDHIAREQHRGHNIRLAVNLSAASISDPELPDTIAQLLDRANAKARGLCVEITETAAIVNIGQARQFARRIHDLGCSLALDDFGAGFASFYYLKHLIFDYIKIDGEFIENLTNDPADQFICKSIVDIAHGLGKHTVAEHVADRGTLQAIRRYGVDYAQGFFVAKPQPLSEAIFTQAPPLRA